MKKLNQIETMEMQNTLDFLIRVAKPVTRKEIRKQGFSADRKILRLLERMDKVTKVEKFAKNTYKVGKDGKTLEGTKYYMYSALE